MTLSATQLEQLGISENDAARIVKDLLHSDPRSLLNELLLRGLWCNVIEEAPALQPALLHRGQSSENGALGRILASGADPHDVADLIREMQIDLIYNVAQLLDWPTEALELDDELEIQLCATLANQNGPSLPLYELHSSLMERDPTGRHGEPRPLILRQFQQLPATMSDEIKRHIQDQHFPAAALIWKRHYGGELKSALSDMQLLAQHLRK